MNLESVASQSSGVQAPAGGSATAPADRPGAQASKASTIQKRFAILATPQTDSSHLIEMLDQHPQIRCLGELFNPKGAVLRDLGWKTRKAMSQAAQSPVEFLERLIGQLEEDASCKPYLGFEMMLHHDPRMIDHLIADPSWTIIVLERRDLLAQWLDMAVAKKNGRWEVGGIQSKRLAKDDGDDLDDDDDFDDDGEGGEGGEGGSPVVRKVKFDAWRFEQFCFRMQARYASTYHRLEKRKYFKLYSEEMDATYPELLEFLGVEPETQREQRPPKPPLQLRDRIENYEDYARYAKKAAER